MTMQTKHLSGLGTVEAGDKLSLYESYNPSRHGYYLVSNGHEPGRWKLTFHGIDGGTLSVGSNYAFENFRHLYKIIEEMVYVPTQEGDRDDDI